MHVHNRRCTRGMPIRQKIEHFVPDRHHNGCWIWTGALSRGYGMIQLGGSLRRAHRVSYEEYVGPIPDGMQIDHVSKRGCTSKACVNPAHLEPVTSKENTNRYHGGVCKRGHAMDGLTTSSRGPKRYCKTCRREARQTVGHLAVRFGIYDDHDDQEAR